MMITVLLRGRAELNREGMGYRYTASSAWSAGDSRGPRKWHLLRFRRLLVLLSDKNWLGWSTSSEERYQKKM